MNERSVLLLTRSPDFAGALAGVGRELGFAFEVAETAGEERPVSDECRPVIVDADSMEDPVELTRRLAGSGFRVLFAGEGSGSDIELPSSAVWMEKPVTVDSLAHLLEGDVDCFRRRKAAGRGEREAGERPLAGADLAVETLASLRRLTHCGDEGELGEALSDYSSVLPRGRLWLLEVEIRRRQLVVKRIIFSSAVGGEDAPAPPPLDLVGMRSLTESLERGEIQGGALRGLPRAFRRCLAERGAWSYCLSPVLSDAPVGMERALSALDAGADDRALSHLLVWEGLEPEVDTGVVVESLGTLGRLLGLIIDSLGSRRADAEAGVLLRKVFLHTPTPYQSLDAEGRVVLVNESWLEELGYGRDEVIGRPFADLVAPSCRERQRGYFDRFKERGVIKDLELELLRSDGTTLPVLFNGRAEYNDEGRFLRTHCTFSNLSDTKAYEEIVVDSEMLFRSLADNHRDGLALYSDEKRCSIYVNSALEEILGVERHRLIKLDLDEFLGSHVHPEDRSFVEERLAETRALRREGYSAPLDLEFRIHRPDGEERWLRWRSSPRTDRSGSPTGETLLTFTDVTESMLARRDVRMRDRILSTVAGIAELLLQHATLDEVIDEALRRLGEAAGVSRAYIFRNRLVNGELRYDQLYEWAAPGIEPQLDNPDLQDASYVEDGFGVLAEMLESDNVYAGPVEELDPGCRPLLEVQGILSLAAVPIHTREGWWGFLGFDDCVEKRRWSGAEIEALRSAAGIIGQALIRERATRSLADSEERHRTIVNSMSDFIFVLDDEDRFVDAHFSDVEKLLSPPERFMGKTMADVMPPVVTERYRAAAAKLRKSGESQRYQYPLEINHETRWFLSTLDLHTDGKVIVAGVKDITELKAAEEALRVERERLEHILDITGTRIDIVDADFNLHYVDNGWQKVYGDPTGRKCYEYFMGSKGPCPGCGVPRALETREVIVTEERLPREGDRVIEVHTIPFQDDDGRWLVAEFNVDITERQAAEEKIAEERQQLLSVFNSVDEIIYIADPETYEVLYTNLKLTELLGRDCVGERCYEVFQDLDAPCEFCTNEIILKTMPKGHHWEFYNKKLGRHLAIVDRIIRWTDDRDVRFEMAIDITERRLAEDLLKESEEKFRQIAENLHEVFWLRDADNKSILYINPAYENVWGRSCQSLYDHPDSFIDSVHDEDKPKVYAEFKKYTEGGLFNLEYRIVRPDGGIRWVHARSIPVLDDTGEVVRHTGIAVDITERKAVEEALRRSEEKYRTLQENLPPGVFRVTAQGEIISANPTLAAVLGYDSVEELLGVDTTSFYAGPRQREELLAGLKEREQVNDFEAALKKRDGTEFIASLDARGVFDESGELSYFDGILIDVTERRRSQQAILRAKQEWERTFDTVPDMVAIIDGDYRISRVNRATAVKLGVEPSELIGKPCYEVFHSSNEPLKGCPHVRMLKDGREHIEELKILDGEYLVSVTPLLDDDGNITGAVHVARDITESKKVERELGRSRESYRLLSAQFEGMLSAVTDRVVFVNPEKEVVWVNRAVEQWLGLPVEELRGRDIHLLWGSGDNSCATCALEKALATGQREECVRFEKERRYEVTAYSVRDAKGLIGVIEVLRDITEKHEAQEAVQRQSMVNQVERIFSSIRHEIGNALNTLKTTITVLKSNIDTFTPEKREAYFQRSLETFKVAERLLRTLKEYQKFDQLETEKLYLDRFLLERSGLLIDNAHNNGVKVKLALDCPHILVNVDRDALVRILLNIIDNAISACLGREEPLIVISSRRVSNWGVVTVTDNGAGVNEKDLPYVFTPLYTTKREGSGLGLAIVQKLMQQMGGLVRLESVEGEGTRVTLRLPIAGDTGDDSRRRRRRY